MLYSNITRQIKQRVINDYELIGFNGGERGRGRYEFWINNKLNNIINIEKGLNDCSVCMSKSGKTAHLIPDDNKLYLFISTYGGYTRRGNGYLLSSEKDSKKLNIMLKGNGADGDAGRIGYWNEYLIEVLEDIVLRVNYSGGSEDGYIVIQGDNIMSFESLGDMTYYYDNIDEDMPEITSGLNLIEI